MGILPPTLLLKTWGKLEDRLSCFPTAFLRRPLVPPALVPPALVPLRLRLGGVYRAHKLHDLITDLGRGFVLNPVAHMVDFEIPHQTRKAGAEFFEGWIELPQPIQLSRNVKGRLGDLRAFPGPGKIEIRLGSAVVVQGAVKAGTLKFGYVMSDII